jgi:hypothetical protein
MQDLGTLPLRALVAFSARCARRVFRVLVAREDSPEKQVALENAIASLELAESFARGELTSAEEAVALAEATAQSASDQLGKAQFAVHAASHAARTAGLASRFRSTGATLGAMDLVAVAWGSYRVVLAFTNGPIIKDFITGDLIEAAVRADFDHLIELRTGEFGELGQPVDPSEQGTLGPLWPAGVPSCW